MVHPRTRPFGSPPLTPPLRTPRATPLGRSLQAPPPPPSRVGCSVCEFVSLFASVSLGVCVSRSPTLYISVCLSYTLHVSVSAILCLSQLRLVPRSLSPQISVSASLSATLLLSISLPPSLNFSCPSPSSVLSLWPPAPSTLLCPCLRAGSACPARPRGHPAPRMSTTAYSFGVGGLRAPPCGHQGAVARGPRAECGRRKGVLRAGETPCVTLTPGNGV